MFVYIQLNMKIIIYKEILTNSSNINISNINILITKKNRKSLHTKCYKIVWTHLINRTRLYIYIEDTILCTYGLYKHIPYIKQNYYISQSNVINNLKLFTQDETIELYEIMNQKSILTDFIQQLINIYLYSQ